MRSDKDQMTAGKEKSIFEIQLKDVPREQENIPANAKPKEEKKEVFTKVRSRACCLRTDMETRGGGKDVSAPRIATGSEEGSFRKQWENYGYFYFFFFLLNCFCAAVIGHASAMRLTLTGDSRVESCKRCTEEYPVIPS